MRAILIWLAISGIKSGKIFPGLDEFEGANLNSLRTDSPESSLSYKAVLGAVRDLCLRVLNMPVNDDTLFGTHMLKKTAFLLAVWSIIQFRNSYKVNAILIDEVAGLMDSGRHKNANTTVGYIADSGILKLLQDRVGTASDKEKHKVGDWHNVRTSENPAFKRIMRSSGTNRTVLELADLYTFEKLEVAKDWRARGVSISEIFAKSSAFKPDPTLNERLQSALEQHIPDVNARNLVQDMVQEQVSQTVHAILYPAAPIMRTAPAGANAAVPVGVTAAGVAQAGGAAPTGSTQATSSDPSERRGYHVVPKRNYQQDAKDCGTNKRAKV